MRTPATGCLMGGTLKTCPMGTSAGRGVSAEGLLPHPSLTDTPADCKRSLITGAGFADSDGTRH